MTVEDMFKPYSPETHGDLLAYLRDYDGTSADNKFFGPEFFDVLHRLNLLVPSSSGIRFNLSPAPDRYYSVSSEFSLEGSGDPTYNMSCIAGDRGLHDPEKVLKDLEWSVHHLNFRKLFLAPGR